MVEGRRTRRAGLTRETVLRAALQIADAEGIDALSFRRLAAHFDVTPMALYRYVASKEALLDGLGDLVLAELELPETAKGDWRGQLVAVARSFRACLLAHPAAVAIFLTRPLVTPAATRAADALLGLLRRGGFAPEQAALLYQLLARFLFALVSLEVASGAGGSEDERRRRMRVARIALESLPVDEYPYLVEAAPYLTAQREPDAAFEAGLELLVAGLERLRPTATTRVVRDRR